MLLASDKRRAVHADHGNRVHLFLGTGYDKLDVELVLRVRGPVDGLGTGGMQRSHAGAATGQSGLNAQDNWRTE